MSHALQNPPGTSQSQFPGSDPSLAPYPSHSLSLSHGQSQTTANHHHLQNLQYPAAAAYPPNNPNAHSTSEAASYRASPTGSNGSSLPSMRTLDHQQQQPQQLHNMNSGLPPPGGPYYHNTGTTLPHPYGSVTSDPNGQNMRYALPVTDSRVMSGGRHKKVRGTRLRRCKSARLVSRGSLAPSVQPRRADSQSSLEKCADVPSRV